MIRHLISLLLFGVSVLFGYFYYIQYYRWRDCFDESGRCFDPQSGVVYLAQSGLGWIILTVLPLAAAIIWKRWSRKFGPVFKMDRMMEEVIQNEETKEPFT